MNLGCIIGFFSKIILCCAAQWDRLFFEIVCLLFFKGFSCCIFEKNIGIHFIINTDYWGRSIKTAKLSELICRPGSLKSKLLFELRCLCVFPSVCLSFCKKNFFVQNGSNSQIRWTDISNSRIQARRAWRLVFNKMPVMKQ